MQLNFFIKRGDTSPGIQFALLPESVSLVLADVQFQMRKRGGGPTVIDAPAIVTSEEPPVVAYEWQPADTATTGWYEAEFRVTYFDGSVETFPNAAFINVFVNDDVADL